MKKNKFKYYNEMAFKYIQKLVNENRLDKAVIEYEKYLSKYPEDCCCYAYYADALIKLGRFDEAKEMLESAVISSKTPDASKQNILLMTLKLMSCEQKYEECLEFVRENSDIFDKRNWNVTELLIYFKKKLGLLKLDNYDGYSYRIDQITNYREEAAIECIKRCHTFSDSNPSSYFNDDFKIEDFYYKLRAMLPLENKIYWDVVENLYIFKYENCGIVNNRPVNYIKVITLQESNDIITMFPYENKEKMGCTDLTPINECSSNVKIKRMSQIDKFNQRYLKN